MANLPWALSSHQRPREKLAQQSPTLGVVSSKVSNYETARVLLLGGAATGRRGNEPWRVCVRS